MLGELAWKALDEAEMKAEGRNSESAGHLFQIILSSRSDPTWLWFKRYYRDGNSRTNGAEPALDGHRGRGGFTEGTLPRPHGEAPLPGNQQRRAWPPRLSHESASRSHALSGAKKRS